jgi:hypothetical protein
LASGAGLEVEPDQQQVEGGVVAGGADRVDELGELVVGEGASAAAGSAGLASAAAGLVARRPAATARANSAPSAATQVSWLE